MKKRLVSLFLCLVTVLTLVLTGCGEQSDEDVNAKIDAAQAEGATTLTMWVVTDQAVNMSDENSNTTKVYREVTEAINKLTQENYKTKLEIKYFTEQEYYSQLSSTIYAYVNTYNQPVSTDLTQGIYPALLPHQVDIVYIGDLHNTDGTLLMSGEDMYREMIANGWLAELDTHLDTSTAKKIREYVSPTLLSAAIYGGKTYAIPNNNVMGEYTYMLLNRELLEHYRLDGKLKTGEITGFYNEYVYQFINMIVQENTSGVLPIDATYDECLSLLAHYWSIDPDKFSLDSEVFSVFGTLKNDFASLSRGEFTLGVESLFTNPEFVSAYLQLNKYRLNATDVFSDDSSATYEKSAIKFVTGTLDDLTIENDIAMYIDGETTYYAVPVVSPTVTSDDAFGSMFGVCAYNNPDRIADSMEIITYINTNAEIRNLLQYGIAGTHYILENNVPVRNERGELYKMDLYKTGNAFLAYPEVFMKADIWKNGKVQNGDALIAPTMGFDMKEYASSLTLASKLLPSSESRKKYELSYSTGYSKEVLGQNALIFSWIYSCDLNPTKGIYMLRTMEKEGTTIRNVYYMYNNQGACDAVITSRQLTADGGTTVNGLDVVIDYTAPSGEGYELSIIKASVPDTYQGKVYCNVAGADTGYSVVVHNDVVDFDILNTSTYSVDTYENLTLAHFYGTTVYDQLLVWRNDGVTDESTYELSWNETADGKTTYHYVIYRKNLAKATGISIQPVGSAYDINLNINYTAYPDAATQNYALAYVTLTVEAGVAVKSPVHILANQVLAVADTNKIVAAMPYDFDLCGIMDTLLIKKVDALNTEISALLAQDYASYSDFEKVVKDLSLLLNGTSAADPSLFESDAVRNAFGARAAEIYDLVRLYIAVGDSKTVLEASDDSLKIEEIGESIIPLYSPYGIYYKWLEANNYIPQPQQ